MLSLAHGAGMLSIHFGKRELKGRKRRIEQIAQSEVVGPATRETVQAAEAAMAAAMVTTTVVHH